PGAYNPDKVKLDHSPAYSFGIKHKGETLRDTPAPSAYQPEKCKNDCSPAFSFGVKVNHEMITHDGPVVVLSDESAAAVAASLKTLKLSNGTSTVANRSESKNISSATSSSTVQNGHGGENTFTTVTTTRTSGGSMKVVRERKTTTEERSSASVEAIGEGLVPNCIAGVKQLANVQHQRMVCTGHFRA
uniref:Uncharacterized protein n=1 Tax=Anopheles maculatus TaxID=74869 RepID=A0A182T5F5_9DIPT